MSDIKLPQGSDYHGNGKYYSKNNVSNLLKHIMSIEKVNAELKEKVTELETELYFCNRNKRIGEVVDERTKVETR